MNWQPYTSKDVSHFWRSAVASVPPDEITLLRSRRFVLDPGTIVSTAGSCFAQNVAKHLRASSSVRVLESEPVADDQPLFSALYGNIYTVRQLVQLFEEAFGQRQPSEIVLKRGDGRYVDGLRPYIFTAGFASPDEVWAARAGHLSAVRRVFTECSLFVFTLGLTESWRSLQDGTVYPVAPGVVSDDALLEDYEFHNFTYDEVTDDLHRFVHLISGVNATVRIILTVSPVPLTATYTDEHILVATTHSKSILRAACADAEAKHPAVCYFPAYEIITGSYARGNYYESNLRDVTQLGVQHVMRVFAANFQGAAPPQLNQPRQESPPMAVAYDDPVICDEEEIVKSMGFK